MQRNGSNRGVLLAIGTAIGLAFAPGVASAQNAVDIGGKFNITGLASVVSTNPDDGDDTTTVIANLGAGYTTENGRFEVGLGAQGGGFFSDADVTFYSGTAQVRVNSNALGPDENVILYVGGVGGVAYIELDADSIDDFDDTLGVGGPKAGLEVYLSPNTALQVEDQFTFDSDGGTTNTVLVGFKFLFD